MTFPKKVRIVEVSPRDGLQNEPAPIPTATKIELINRLSTTGLQTIEATSFVSPKWIPQLADGEAVFTKIKKHSNVHYPVLVPNVEGLEQALKAGARAVSVLCAASETFSKKNTHCSIAESFTRIEAVFKLAKEHKVPVRAYLSCALVCPFEGEISKETVAKIANRLFQIGCYEISLSDTIGAGTPKKAKNLIEAVANTIPIPRLAIHFHDTYGQALANIYACLELGISVIDSSVGGLGGCPYAKGATGNVATEDLLYMLQGLGIETGVDLNALLEVSQFVSGFTGHPPYSKVAKALGSTTR